MKFEQFQNQSRLYVIGALEPEELDEFEKARKRFGKKADDFISKCYALHEAFALSLRPEKSSDGIKEPTMAMGKAQKESLFALGLNCPGAPGRRRLFRSRVRRAGNPTMALISSRHSSRCSEVGWRGQAVHKRDRYRQSRQGFDPNTRSLPGRCVHLFLREEARRHVDPRAGLPPFAQDRRRSNQVCLGHRNHRDWREPVFPALYARQ